MRHIDRNSPPQSLADWKSRETVPDQRRYEKKDGGSLPSAVKSNIREARIIDQYFLCAYTMRSIRKTSCNGEVDWDAHIEHVISQHNSRKRFEGGEENAFDDTIDYKNMLACVDRNSSVPYGAPARGNVELKVHPFQKNCQQRFRYKLDGKVVGLTPDASKVVEILKLNHSALVELRRSRMAAEGFAIPKPKTPGRKKGILRRNISAAKARNRAIEVIQPYNGKLTEFCIAIADGATKYAELVEKESQRQRFIKDK